MSEKQILVDEDKIQATQIVVNVKTLVIIVGFIATSIGTMFGLLNSSISDVQKSVDDLEIIKVEPLDDAFHTLDKQVYFLINRTNSRQALAPSGTAPEATPPTLS